MSDESKVLFTADFRRDPYPFFRRMRASTPVRYFPAENVWAITRWDDVVDVLRRPEAFSSVLEDVARNPVLNGADPPSHTRVRRLLGKAMSSNVLDSLLPRINQHIHRLIDELPTTGEFDFMEKFARPFPLLVVADVLGMDVEKCAYSAEWAHNEWMLSHGKLEPAERALRLQQRVEFDHFFSTFVEQCSTRSTGGVLDPLLQPGSFENRLEPFEAQAMVREFVLAATMTTTNLLGNALFALFSNPDQLALVRRDPSRVASMTEEVLRFETPTQLVQRRATREVKLADVVLPADAQVIVFIGSANRDETHFSDAHRFLIERADNDHIAFGLGPHYCLGARLTRIEAYAALTAIFERLPDLRPTRGLVGVHCGNSIRLRGLARLDVTAAGNC